MFGLLAAASTVARSSAGISAMTGDQSRSLRSWMRSAWAQATTFHTISRLKASLRVRSKLGWCAWLSVKVMMSRASTRVLFTMPPHSVRASHHRPYALLFRKPMKMARAPPCVAALV